LLSILKTLCLIEMEDLVIDRGDEVSVCMCYVVLPLYPENLMLSCCDISFVGV
jgi:hypothetical protein